MRVFPISLGIATSALFLIACGQESESPPTSPSVPTEIPTTVPNPASTPTTAPTETIPTSTTEPEPAPTEPPAANLAPERDLDIVTLLPPDAIPAIDNPIFFETTEEADAVYGDGEYVLGVEIEGDARAYSVPLLSSHEIVNDTVAGRPIAVTW